MTIDLLVCNYNTKELLDRLISVLNADWEPDVWKLYIMDNDSTDDSKKFLQDIIDFQLLDKLHIEKIFFNSNVGYAKAINSMSVVSSSEILCALNADTWFSTRHVKQVFESFNEHPEMAICGVKQMDESSKIRHGGIFWDGVHNPTHRGWGEVDPLNAKYRDKVQCWTVSGSIYYVRRSVWEKLSQCETYTRIAPDAQGAFLPTPHFFEETYCSVHAQQHGYEVWYDGRVDTAGHTWQASSPDKTDASRKHFNTSKELYIRACDAHGIHHEYAGKAINV